MKLSIAEPQIKLGEINHVNRRSGSKRRNFEEKFAKKDYTRVAMLNLSRLGGFKYDIREIFADCEMDSTYASALLANIIAKASRVSISEAKGYVRSEQMRGAYPTEISEDICILLDRYSKYR
jgi:hypothetical protein